MGGSIYIIIMIIYLMERKGTRTMGKPSLKFRYHRGPSIAEPLLREIWTVRVGMLELNRSEEDDWAYFSSFVRRDDTVVLGFYDGEGRVRGFFTISYIPFEFDGRKDLLLFSKYFYFQKAYRGHYKTLAAPWVLLPIGFKRYGLRRLHFVTSAFPQSFVSLSRSSGNVHTLKGEATSDWEKKALTHFARSFYGDDFDEAAGVVRNQNLVDTPGLPMSEEGRRLAAEYERLNPDWRKGCTLPILFSVNAGMLHNALSRTFRRVLPRSKRAELTS